MTTCLIIVVTVACKFNILNVTIILGQKYKGCRKVLDLTEKGIKKICLIRFLEVDSAKNFSAPPRGHKKVNFSVYIWFYFRMSLARMCMPFCGLPGQVALRLLSYQLLCAPKA